MQCLQTGHAEPLKAGVHGLIGLLALGALGYNVGAWLERRERHLAWNAILYGVLLGLETKKTYEHLVAHRQSGEPNNGR